MRNQKQVDLINGSLSKLRRSVETRRLPRFSSAETRELIAVLEHELPAIIGPDGIDQFGMYHGGPGYEPRGDEIYLYPDSYVEKFPLPVFKGTGTPDDFDDDI